MSPPTEGEQTAIRPSCNVEPIEGEQTDIRRSYDGEPNGESETVRVERLGRQRPEKLGSMWKEIGFVFSIAMSQALTEYFVSGFTVIVPTIVEELEIPATSTTWPASVFSLVVSAFLLPFGRLADIYGGFPVYIAGFVWFCVWSL
ncbi:hypothetical protein KC352_g44515, partial [Hortaea werneckii]